MQNVPSGLPPRTPEATDSTVLGSAGPPDLPQVSQEPGRGHRLGAGKLRRVPQKGGREGDGWTG